MPKQKRASFKIRLDKFIANQMPCSREDAKEYIKRRVVTVNGTIAKLFDMKIDAENDKVIVDGNEILYRKHIYIMLNKPQGVVCAAKDRDFQTVIDLVPENLRRKDLFPAGRLDKDTEGFVLITDDGKLAHDMLSPKKHVPKVYFARLSHEADESYIEKFESGMKIDNGDICLPAKIEILDKRDEVLITLKEGMFHQVKRMINACSNEVIFLKRIKIGGFDLDENLSLGECREILHKEIDKFYIHF